MCMYSATDGMPNDFHLVHLGARAMGGAGLVFTEMTDVSARGAHHARLRGHVHGRARRGVEAHRRRSSTRAVGAKIGMQLGHAGRKGVDEAHVGGHRPARSRAADWPIDARLGAPLLPGQPGAAARWTARDMDDVKADFVARDAGCADGRASTCSSSTWRTATCSRASSRRSRTCAPTSTAAPSRTALRFPLEVLEAVRAAWLEHKPLSVRISAVDWQDGGTTEEDSVALLAHAEGARAATSSTCSTGQTTPDAQAGLRPHVADALRRSHPPRGRRSRRSRSATSPPAIRSTRSSRPGAPISARSRAPTSTIRTSRSTRRTSRGGVRCSFRISTGSSAHSLAHRGGRSHKTIPAAPAGLPGSRLVAHHDRPMTDQSTRKISASQLAAVLAKADETLSAEEAQRKAAVMARAEDASGPRPAAGRTPSFNDADAVTKLATLEPAAAQALAELPSVPPPSAAPPQVLAVVERPVGDAKVVNATSPETPAHSSGRLPSASDAGLEAAEPEAAAGVTEERVGAAHPSLPVVLPKHDSRFGVALVVLLFVACCVVLVWFDHP